LGRKTADPAQIDYARFDTHYLFQLRDMLERELEEKGRWNLPARILRVPAM
jgi:ribonuclease D